MASRYGRKKRRQHREQIVALEKEVLAVRKAAQGPIRTVQELEAKIDEWNEDTISLLGEYSAFLSEPSQVAVKHLMRRVAIRPPVSYDCNPSHSSDLAMDRVSFRVAALHTFHCMCDEDKVKLSTLIRFYQVNAETGQRVYTVGEDLAPFVHKTHRDPRELAYILAQNIIDHWQRRSR
jgi:hypothetical protein